MKGDLPSIFSSQKPQDIFLCGIYWIRNETRFENFPKELSWMSTGETLRSSFL
jgi:hypothetical protein